MQAVLASVLLARTLSAEGLSPRDPAGYPLVVATTGVEDLQSGTVVPIPSKSGGKPIRTDLVWFEGCLEPHNRKAAVVLLLEAELSAESAVPVTAWRSTREWAALLASYGLAVAVVAVPAAAEPEWLIGFLESFQDEAKILGLDTQRLALWVRGRAAELVFEGLASAGRDLGIQAVAAIAGVGPVSKLPEDIASLLVIPGNLPAPRLESSREIASRILAQGLSGQILQVPGLAYGYDWLDPSEASRRTVEAVANFLASQLLASPPPALLESDPARERSRWHQLLRGEVEAVHQVWNEAAGGPDGRDPQLWRALALARRSMGSAVGEMAALEQAVELEPERLDQRQRWGKLAGRLGGWRFVEEAFGPILDHPDLDDLDLGLLGLARLRAGKPLEAILPLERAVAIGGGAANRYNLACAYALVGRAQQALQELEGAVDAGFTDEKLLESDPDLASVRGTPRFDAILKRLKRTTSEGTAPPH